MGPPLAWGRPSWNQTWLGMGIWPQVPRVTYWSGSLPAHGWSVVAVIFFISRVTFCFFLSFSFFHFDQGHAAPSQKQSNKVVLLNTSVAGALRAPWKLVKIIRNSYFFHFFLSFMSSQRYLILPLLLLLFFFFKDVVAVCCFCSPSPLSSLPPAVLLPTFCPNAVLFRTYTLSLPPPLSHSAQPT